jgi:hypothetical protein
VFASNSSLAIRHFLGSCGSKPSIPENSEPPFAASDLSDLFSKAILIRGRSVNRGNRCVQQSQIDSQLSAMMGGMVAGFMVLGLGSRVEVVEPSTLRDRIRAEVTKVASRIL